MQVGIAMLPDSTMLASIAALQAQIIPIVPLRPILGTQTNLPHITLLQGRFREDTDWLTLFAALRDYCTAQRHSWELELAGLECRPGGWYFLLPKQSELLFAAHRFAFAHLKHAMYLTAEDRQKDTSSYALLEKENYLAYGYRFIGDAYYPHVTLGRASDELSSPDLAASVARLVDSYPWQRKGTIRKISLYEMGENGSHAATLAELDLPSCHKPLY